MQVADLFESAEPLSEVHYTDMYTKGFEDFRKKYMALAKQRSLYDIYVQFTSKDNAMDRTAFQTPDHSDPVGTYAYPIAYVLSHPADVWYGKGARYLRVLQSRARKPLQINHIDSINEVERMLMRLGFNYSEVEKMLKIVKKEYKNRIDGSNKLAKLFFQAAQVDVLAGPTGKNGWGKNEYRIRTGAEQTALFRKAGYDAIIDTSRNNKQAVINSREPEQIIFLNRGAFRVLEVFALRPLGHIRQNPDPNQERIKRDRLDRGLPTITHGDPGAQRVERPFVATIARMLGDQLSEGPESSSLGGWHAYWTKKGRRIQVKFDHTPGYYDNKQMGEKKHKADKLFDTYEIDVEIETEHGKLEAGYDEKTKFKDVIADLLKDWISLQKQPVDPNWQPETRALFLKKREDARTAYYRKKAEEERQKKLKELPKFLQDVEWAANHYGLPFTPNEDFDLNVELPEAVGMWVSIVKDNPQQMEEADKVVRDLEFEGPKSKLLIPQWEQIVAILNKAWPELHKHERAWWMHGGWGAFGGMRRILKGWRPGEPDPDYTPVTADAA